MVTLAHFSFLLSDEDFYVANTHYDDRGIKAREKSSSLILSKLAPHITSGKLVVVTGDLNSPAGEEGYRVLTGHRYVGGKFAVNAGSQSPMGAKIMQGLTTFIDSRHELITRSTLLNGGKKPPGLSALAAPYGEKDTYTGFRSWERSTLIDYILLADNDATKGGSSKESAKAGWVVAKYGVLPNHFGNGVWVSDHRMVVVTLKQG